MEESVGPTARDLSHQVGKAGRRDEGSAFGAAHSSSNRARPASKRATGTRNGEQET